MSYLGHRPGSKDTSWKYAHYDGRTSSIPAAATTDVLNYIWDSFGKEQKKLLQARKTLGILQTLHGQIKPRKRN